MKNTKDKNKKLKKFTIIVSVFLSAFIFIAKEIFTPILNDVGTIASNKLLPSINENTQETISAINETIIDEDTYNLQLNQMKEYQFDDKTTYNFYTGSFSIEENALNSKKQVELKITENNEFYDLCKKYIDQNGKHNYMVNVIKNSIDMYRVCILKGIKGTEHDMSELERAIEEKFNMSVEFVAYNKYVNSELEIIENLIYNKEFKKALDGLLKLRLLCKETYINGFSEYDRLIEKIILDNDKLKELYIVGKHTRDDMLNFIDHL